MINVFTVTFDQFNASLLNKKILTTLVKSNIAYLKYIYFILSIVQID